MTARIDAIWDELAIMNNGKGIRPFSPIDFPTERRMTTLSCKVTSVDAITDTVYRVRLVPEAAFSFRAGQYLMVVMDERDKRPFSMASTPAEKEFIELHIGASEA